MYSVVVTFFVNLLWNGSD